MKTNLIENTTGKASVRPYDVLVDGRPTAIIWALSTDDAIHKSGISVRKDQELSACARIHG